MPKKRNQIDFDVVRKIALELPEVEESMTSRGRSLKVSGRLLACPAIHDSAEPNSLMVRISFDERARRLATEPDTYYLTEHYSSYPAILVRLSKISRDSLQELLESAWQFVNTKSPKVNRQSARQKHENTVRTDENVRVPRRRR